MERQSANNIGQLLCASASGYTASVSEVTVSVLVSVSTSNALVTTLVNRQPEQGRNSCKALAEQTANPILILTEAPLHNSSIGFCNNNNIPDSSPIDCIPHLCVYPGLTLYTSFRSQAYKCQVLPQLNVYPHADTSPIDRVPHLCVYPGLT